MLITIGLYIKLIQNNEIARNNIKTQIAVSLNPRFLSIHYLEAHYSTFSYLQKYNLYVRFPSLDYFSK